MVLPEDPDHREMFISLFRAAIKSKRFQPVDLIKQQGFQDVDILDQIGVLSLLHRYCIVWGTNDWEIRPMVIHKYQTGYYDQFGI